MYSIILQTNFQEYLKYYKIKIILISLCLQPIGVKESRFNFILFISIITVYNTMRKITNDLNMTIPLSKNLFQYLNGFKFQT